MEKFESIILPGSVYFIAGLLFSAFITFAVVSLWENELRAARRSLFLSVTLPSLILLMTLIPPNIQGLVIYSFLICIILGLIILFFPIHRLKGFVESVPSGKIDERDIMFSRRLYKPGSERYAEYYQQKPQFKEIDDKFRKNPGLLGKGSTYYKQFAFNAAEASFETISGLHHLVSGKAEAVDTPGYSAQEFTSFLKGWIKNLGAHSVGITELKSYHIYSHVGRGPDFGMQVQLDHKFAIALTVEMEKEALDSAPFAPTVMESARQYVNAGVIVIQVTEFIRKMGFEARAHIDGNYRVVCPLVARDAGLGEIGRMGLLMTPRLGPRVRIAVITADIPLIEDEPVANPTVHEFCLRCKKCADVCPSRAISFEPPTKIDGIERWQINQEKCFTYWTVCGTDCGRCISVCPYSHPDNFLHNLVRKGLRQSSFFQILALKMDDFFYGRKPAPLKPEGYLDF